MPYARATLRDLRAYGLLRREGYRPRGNFDLIDERPYGLGDNTGGDPARQQVIRRNKRSPNSVSEERERVSHVIDMFDGKRRT